LTADDEARIEQVPTEDLSAYEYYLLGKTVAETRYAEGWDVVERAIQFYERAIQADSGFVRAYASMASAYASYH